MANITLKQKKKESLHFSRFSNPAAEEGELSPVGSSSVSISDVFCQPRRIFQRRGTHGEHLEQWVALSVPALGFVVSTARNAQPTQVLRKQHHQANCPGAKRQDRKLRTGISANNGPIAKDKATGNHSSKTFPSSCAMKTVKNSWKCLAETEMALFFKNKYA